jgi:Cu(I)/Ag(I) efflux system membrane fusion protein
MVKVGATALLLVGALASCSRSDAAVASEPAAIRPYLDLAAKLADDRGDDVPALAQQLAAAARAEGDKPGLAKVIAATATMTTELEPTRKAFKGLSDGMIEYMRAVPSTQAGTFIVHCPMAFGDQGALWVQRDGKVANPYFGAAMLRCGNKVAWDAELPKTASL